MFKSLKYLTLVMASIITFTATANANRHPDMYVVFFSADWCGPCKIVEPNLSRALGNLRDPGIERVDIDISNPRNSEIGAHLAFDRNIVRQYNEWLGVTGFAAIIDADTKNTLGCVTMMYDAHSMAMHIKNLKTYALANQQSFDLTCPAPNNRLP
jgi:thiol-disulfide isomerase/thioredoxin